MCIRDSTLYCCRNLKISKNDRRKIHSSCNQRWTRIWTIGWRAAALELSCLPDSDAPWTPGCLYPAPDTERRSERLILPTLSEPTFLTRSGCKRNWTDRGGCLISPSRQSDHYSLEGYLSHPALWLRSALSGRNYWCKRVWQIFKEETLFTDGRYHSEAGW